MNIETLIAQANKVIDELDRDYDYEDAEREAEEIGLDADETLVMALENRVQLGVIWLRKLITALQHHRK